MFIRVSALKICGDIYQRNDWRPEYVNDDDIELSDFVINTNHIVTAEEFEVMGQSNTMVYTELELVNERVIFVTGGFSYKLLKQIWTN